MRLPTPHEAQPGQVKLLLSGPRSWPWRPVTSSATRRPIHSLS